ncbi:MAG: helix-turn-helix domain-containing protein [Lachnospiraceae bacterium]|nr:helix-turn-helix domain-containing protein [Lachnospiraceae bacterium]
MSKKPNEEMTIAYRIKYIRESKRLSQAELAERAGYVDKSSISKIENSGNDISLKKINKIADALGVSPNDLLANDETGLNLRILEDSDERVHPGIMSRMNQYSKLLKNFHSELEEVRRLVEESKRVSSYHEFGKSFDEAMDIINEKEKELNDLFCMLKKAVGYEDDRDEDEEASR